MLAPVYETIRRVKASLEPRCTCWGFAGRRGRSPATWSPAVARRTKRRRGCSPIGTPTVCSADRLLVEASADYLVRQLEAGADAVQIFDTWAGVLPPDEFGRWCIEPARRSSRRSGSRCRAPGSSAFRVAPAPAAALCRTGSGRCGRARLDGRSGLRARPVQWRTPVQGNLDPLVLLAGGRRSTARSTRCSRPFPRPFIFNLGHGILPDTPIEHVEQMMKRVRAGAEGRNGKTSPLARAVVALAITVAGSCGLFLLWRPSWLYPWIKALHVIAIIAWMAGMLYLPRLFVYHCDAEPAPSNPRPSR